MSTKTDPVTLEIEMKNEADKYILSLIIRNIPDEIVSFNFSNSSGGFARNCINIFDENKETYKQIGKEYMSPITYNVEEINLEKGEEHVILLNGKLREYEYGKTLEFKGLSIFIEKEKKYYMQIKYRGVASNMLEFAID